MRKELSNQRFWNRVAKIYGPFMSGSESLYDDIDQRIRPYLRADMNVLELACGSGQLSFSLAGDVRLWEATDFSREMIAEAKKRRRPRNLYFSVQDATNLPYASESFDAAVISNALHIMPNPDLALSEIRRVLKPNGFLFAPTFLHTEQARSRLQIRFMELAGFHTFYKWNESSFIAYLEEHGFHVTEHQLLTEGLMPLCFTAAKPNSFSNMKQAV